MSFEHPAPLLNKDKAVKIEIFDGDNPIGTATVVGDKWTFEHPVTLGEHIFTARSNSIVSAPWRLNVVEDGGLLLSRPTVRDAHPEPGDQERLDYYSDANKDIEIIVDYSMQQGDTVKLYWAGPSITLGSPIQTVKDDPPRLEPFVISKYEVIDAILRNAAIKYTVARPPDTDIHESPSLNLIITGDSRNHNFDVVRPSLNGTTLTVNRQSDFSELSTVEVRAIGQDGTDIWQSSAQAFGALARLEFNVDADWLDRNRGKSVMFNYSLRVTPEQPRHYLYSRLLRIESLS